MSSKQFKKLFSVFAVIFLFTATSCKRNQVDYSTMKGTVIQNCPNDGYIKSVLSKIEVYSWSTLFEKDLSKKILSHYMSCKGTELKLSMKEYFLMDISVDEFYYLEQNPRLYEPFENFVSECERNKMALYVLDKTYSASAFGGTLGYFNLKSNFEFNCKLTEPGKMDISYNGNIQYEDIWDFNASSHRDRGTEARTRFASAFLSGKPYPITGNHEFNGQKTYDYDIIDEDFDYVLGKLVAEDYSILLSDDKRKTPKGISKGYSKFGESMVDLFSKLNK